MNNQNDVSSDIAAAYRVAFGNFSVDTLKQAQFILSSLGENFSSMFAQQANFANVLPSSFSKVMEYYQPLLKSENYSILVKQSTDALRLITAPEVLSLTSSIDHSVSLKSEDFPDKEKSVEQRCVSVLNEVKPYMPENVKEEIEDTVIAPVQSKKKVSFSSLLEILSIVVTILIFLCERIIDFDASQKESRYVSELSATVKQNTESICELTEATQLQREQAGKMLDIAQQLMNDVSELRDQTDSSAELGLETPDTNNKCTDQEALN